MLSYLITPDDNESCYHVGTIVDTDNAEFSYYKLSREDMVHNKAVYSNNLNIGNNAVIIMTRYQAQWDESWTIVLDDKLEYTISSLYSEDASDNNNPLHLSTYKKTYITLVTQ